MMFTAFAYISLGLSPKRVFLALAEAIENNVEKGRKLKRMVIIEPN
jgi:hypothetical protein